MLRDVNWEPLSFVRVGSLTVRTIESEPLTSIGNDYCQVGVASQIVIMRRNAHRLARSQGSHFESQSIAV
jgi:hypothetical protein